MSPKSGKQERLVLLIKILTEEMIENFRCRFSCRRLWRTQVSKHDRFVAVPHSFSNQPSSIKSSTKLIKKENTTSLADIGKLWQHQHRLFFAGLSISKGAVIQSDLFHRTFLEMLEAMRTLFRYSAQAAQGCYTMQHFKKCFCRCYKKENPLILLFETTAITSRL